MEVKTLTYECWGDTIQPITIYFANVCFLFAFCLPGRHVNVQHSPIGWEGLVEGLILPYANFQASSLFLTPFFHSCLSWYLEFLASEPLLGSAGGSFLSCLPLCVSFATASVPFSSVTTACRLLSLPSQLTLYSCFLCLPSSDTTSSFLLSLFQEFINPFHLLKVLTLFSSSLGVYATI